jgi:hypothetical protein
MTRYIYEIKKNLPSRINGGSYDKIVWQDGDTHERYDMDVQQGRYRNASKWREVIDNDLYGGYDGLSVKRGAATTSGRGIITADSPSHRCVDPVSAQDQALVREELDRRYRAKWNSGASPTQFNNLFETE